MLSHKLLPLLSDLRFSFLLRSDCTLSRRDPAIPLVPSGCPLGFHALSYLGQKAGQV
jgi:hypothetical protein